MKSFFFTVEYKKSTYGSKVKNKVYQIVKNRVRFVGEANYSTGSFRGHDHEALHVIVNAKKLPANSLDGGYINYNKRDKLFILEELR